MLLPEPAGMLLDAIRRQKGTGAYVSHESRVATGTSSAPSPVYKMEGRSVAAAPEGFDRDSEGLGIGTVMERVR